MPYPSTPHRWPALREPYGPFRGSHLQGRLLAAIFYPLGHPTPYASDYLLNFSLGAIPFPSMAFTGDKKVIGR
jgi:hypothetical protein